MSCLGTPFSTNGSAKIKSVPSAWIQILSPLRSRWTLMAFLRYGDSGLFIHGVMRVSVGKSAHGIGRVFALNGGVKHEHDIGFGDAPLL